MEKLYFSKRIKEKLLQIHKSCLTVMEAPAGYGKTTAIRWEMDKLPPEQVHWYTAVSFYQDSSTDWLFHNIGRQNREAGKKLHELGFLNRSNVFEAAEILENMVINEPLYLIFDNFQIIRENWSPVLLQALADRKRDGLHIILLSQNFGKLRVAFERSSVTTMFNSRDFLLTEEEIAEYGFQNNINLSGEDSKIIYRNTEGWAAAVSMYLQQFSEREGPLPGFQDMDDLIYEFFWSNLSKEEQYLLLRVAVFECIEEKHLSYVAPGQEAELYNILVRVPLLQVDVHAKSAYPHELLRNFLTKRLEETDSEFRSKVYERTGEICFKDKNMHRAVELFFKAKNYDKLLSCDLSGLLSETFDGLSYAELAEKVMHDCDEKLLAKYPLSMLKLCLGLFGGSYFKSFNKAMEKSHKIIESLNDNKLMGEWYLVAAFMGFPDIKAMKSYYIEAEKLMEGPSDIFNEKEPFMFGTTSMWYLFYRTPGKMMETAEELKDMMEIYDGLTNHHGAGAYELYLGEAFSVQGRFEESDMAVHRAAILSEQWKNVTVTYGVALVLGINAIYQSDMISLQKAVDYLEYHATSYPFMQHTALNKEMAETVRTYLLGLMMEPDRSAKWAWGSSDLLGDLTFTNFMGKTNRITDLILKKEYKRAIASVEASLTLDSRLISLSTKNFMYVGLSLCYLAIGNIARAAEWIEESLTIAEKDRNYTFIACFRKYLSVLFILPSIKKKHGRAIKEIKELNIHYTKAEESHIFSMLDKNPDQMEELTEREREVAHLVAKGYRNKEIAKELFISEETVKSHIRSIFAKTNIDRRSKLIDLLK